MASFMVRLPDDKHERLKELAKARGMSLNKLMEELSTITLAEFDGRPRADVRRKGTRPSAETRFRAMAAQGNPERGIALLDKLDEHFGEGKK